MNFRFVGSSLLFVMLIASPIACLRVSLASADGSSVITIPTDFSTIQAAIDAASAGDTILVNTGICNESALAITKSLTITGQSTTGAQIYLNPPQYPVNYWGQIAMAYNNSITIQADNVEISGLTITTAGGDIVIQGNRNQIINNIMRVNSAVNLAGNENELCNNTITSSVSITGYNNIVANNTVGGMTVSGNGNRISNNYAGYLALSGSYNFLAYNTLNSPFVGGGVGILLTNANYNLVIGNFENGSNVGISIGYPAQPPQAGSYNVFAGNTIEHAALWGILVSTGSYNVFYSNLVTLCGGAGHDGYGISLGGNHLTAENNLFFGNILSSNARNFGVNWNLQGTNYFDNGISGNYWDDYYGTEVGSTGTGNTPYVVYGLTFLLDYHPLIQQPLISTHVPALPQLWASRLGDTLALETQAPPLPSPSASPTPTPLPTTTQTQPPSNIQAPTTPQPTQTPTAPQNPTPLPTATITAIPAQTDRGTTINLAISGNITTNQISNLTITTNQSTAVTIMSFRVTGANGTAGFGNFTIPRIVVPNGSTPIVYMDGTQIQNQGYAQYANNYYVWFTIHFSEHEVSITFVSDEPATTMQPTQKQTAAPTPLLSPTATRQPQTSFPLTVIYAIVAAAVMASVSVTILLVVRKGKKKA